MATSLRLGLFTRPTGLTGRLLQAQLRPAVFAQLGVRGYVSQQFQERHQQRLILREYGMIDDFVPLPRSKRPSLLSKVGFRSAVKHWKNLAATTFAIGTIRFQVKGWRPKPFAQEAQRVYEEMNDAFARGDREALREVCTEGMFSRVKNEIKNRVGTFRWACHGNVEPPRIVSARFGRLGENMMLAQVTVRMHTKQSMAVYNKKNQLIAGNPDQPQNILEYVVMQRVIGPGESEQWQIYGKVHEKPVMDV
ncbi:Tim44-like domain-containing protein [Thamnocephalis sphaerospora]|uniref:Large ribosomal subunit protein mL45 n=1 Tax=Thamnocephalis sphaerospora TaxID=78915 RepID=A0A4P9XWC4_9FUNG|nr:Tim44-like domain-containing protein [Thamnocephalis sphaerospora]|eukprot:RKP10614.1 Tim44-like domain-containing protein [Thamnocephalis sphaerospora]